MFLVQQAEKLKKSLNQKMTIMVVRMMIFIVDNNRMFYSIMENESLIHDTTRSGVE